MGNILLSLLVRFGLIYLIWALVLGLYLGDVIKGLLLVLDPLLLILRLGLGRVGLRAYFLNPINMFGSKLVDLNDSNFLIYF